ncbi:MAG: M48 family metallopeptidase [Pseudonocardia sp.]|nr:M48 family metallopeptidase [Pseudonocardia sp.]
MTDKQPGAERDFEIVRAPRVPFPDISPRAYEHPADKGALAGLRAIPGVSEVLRSAAGLFSERGERLMALASAIRVGERQYPTLDRLRLECAATLDLPALPNVYVARSAEANAFAIGMDQPFIVVTTGLVEALDTEALRFAIGHEMGHVLSGHAVLRTLLIRLINLQASMSLVPLGALGLRAVIAALREWFRKAELTCDRAGLLCCQDPQAALRTHVYLAGGTDLREIDIPSFLRQAEEYEQIEDVRDSIHKFRNVEVMNHPLTVVRAAQLQRWAASADYRRILSGDYPRRGDEAPGSTFLDDLRGAARSYRDGATESSDPLLKMLSEVGAGVSDAAGRLFRGFSGGGGDCERR